MSGVKLGLTVVLAIIGVILIVLVLLQSDRSAGLGTISGGVSSDSYWSKNRKNSIEGSLSTYTKIFGTAFMALAAVINFIH